LFYLICQTSETPEFVFGTAVQSSKASVSEQAPIMIAKAKRKQGCFSKPMKEMIDLVMFYMNKLDPKIVTDKDYKIIFPNITKISEEIRLEQAKVAADNNLASKNTLAKMVGVDQYVDNIDDEVSAAQNEKRESIDYENALYAQQILSTQKDNQNQS
jgi:hypothetical protein